MPAPYAAYAADTISDLVNPQATGRTEVTVLGRLTKGDGGGGVFYWVTGSYTGDNGTVFPLAAAGASPAGAWFRVIDDVYNVKWFGVKGDGTTDDSSNIANALSVASAAKKTLYFPVATYLVNNTVGLPNYAHLKGDGIGKSIIKYNSSLAVPSTNYMFEGDGVSFVEIEGFTFTGNHTTRINAFIGMNSYPNHNREYYIHHNEFTEAACYRAINLGNSDNGSSSSTDVYIQYNWFHELYETGYQNVTDVGFPDAHTCKGINMQSSTRLIDVSYNRFENISSDGIVGLGSNVGGGYLQNNCNIHHNIFYNTWMGIEINGYYMGYNLTIEDNYFYWMRCNAGYAVSIGASYNAKVRNNFMYLHDRGAIEFGTINGVVEGNTIVISPYVSGEGFAGTDTSFSSVSAISATGYANTITNNSFILGYTGSNGYAGSTPTYYKAISIHGKSFNPSTQPSTYNGISDYSAIWTITDNYFENPNGQAIYADESDKPARNVYITNNLFTSRFSQLSMIEIHGYNWQIKNNTFDMTGATAGGNLLVSIYYLQTDDTQSLVSDNTVTNDTWKFSTGGKYVAYRNTFRGTSNTTPYLLYPAPTVTAAQRTALTGVEGMQVYQTDATVGSYIYTSGAWKKVDLV